MNSKVHANATTTPHTRRYIHESGKKPPYLIDFAFLPHFENKLEVLADMSSKENWGEENDRTKYPILRSYIFYTFARLEYQKKILYASDNEHCCFNTGLTDPYYENIYAFLPKTKKPRFAKNKESHAAEWYLVRFTRKSDKRFRNIFDDIFPERANYFDEPSKKVERNYKIAVPYYYRGTLGLLLPLCLIEGSDNADLALTVMEYSNRYLASTCLNLHMAYTNARLIVKPESDWLKP